MDIFLLLVLQLKKAGKGEEKWFDYVYISKSGWDCLQLMSSNHDASLVTMQGPLCREQEDIGNVNILVTFSMLLMMRTLFIA